MKTNNILKIVMCRLRFSTALIVLLATIYVYGSASAQVTKPVASNELSRGIELYKSGEAENAIKIFSPIVKKEKENIDAWFYLGMASARARKPREAIKAYQTVLKLNPNHTVARAGLAWNLVIVGDLDKAEAEIKRVLEVNKQNTEAHFILGTIYLKKEKLAESLTEAELAIASNPQHALSHLLKSQATLATYTQKYEEHIPAADIGLEEYFRKAAESLELFLKYTKSDEELEIWHKQLDTLNFYLQHRDESADEPFAPPSNEPDLIKPVIRKKPVPAYTDAARHAGIEGKVLLLIVLDRDATVTHILVLKSLPYGLTENSIKAAQGIKFLPAMKNGLPVSRGSLIMYNFNLY